MDVFALDELKNVCNGRVRIEREIFMRWQLTPSGHRLVIEDLSKRQTEDPRVNLENLFNYELSGKIDLNGMEFNELCLQWPNIEREMKTLNDDKEEQSYLFYKLLPTNVSMRRERNLTVKEVYERKTNKLVTVTVIPSSMTPMITFARERYQNEDHISPDGWVQKTAEVDIITPEGINRINKLLEHIVNLRNVLFVKVKVHRFESCYM
jgi:hypothetical protein